MADDVEAINRVSGAVIHLLAIFDGGYIHLRTGILLDIIRPLQTMCVIPCTGQITSARIDILGNITAVVGTSASTRRRNRIQQLLAKRVIGCAIVPAVGTAPVESKNLSRMDGSWRLPSRVVMHGLETSAIVRLDDDLGQRLATCLEVVVVGETELDACFIDGGVVVGIVIVDEVPPGLEAIR